MISAARNAPVKFDREGRIGLIRIANPPVNAISAGVVAGLAAALDQFEADPSLQALLLHCEGRTFVAGGDISAFDDPDFSSALYNSTLARIEAQDRPVLCALHGTVLGGGLELALACHYRIAMPGTQFGFPEVKLGILPGSLGTQRAPRLIGIPLALDLIASGRFIQAHEALSAGLIDEVAEGTPLEEGLRKAGTLIERKAAPRRISDMGAAPDGLPANFFEQALAEAARSKPFHPSARRIVQAVQASTLPFAAGEAIELKLFEELRQSPESEALRHLFFAERQAARIPGFVSQDLTPRAIQSVGIVGAGTMGGGIAMNFANAGIPTVIVETSAAALERGLGLIRTSYEASAAKGRLSSAQLAQRMALLRGSLDDQALARCDLVIEAVFEDMDLKQQVCARLGAVCKPGAIIATNTSTLDVDRLALATGRPADVLGMHFFSPAQVMRLLEVVRGAQTAPEVLASVMQLARRIGKVAVVSGVCYGFIGNRMVEPYMREAEFLLLEGASPAAIDAAAESLGMAMGPCRMLDMAGVDVGAKTVIEQAKAGKLPPDPGYRALVRRMFEQGRFGQKTGAGYYRYEGRKASPDPETERIARALAAELGIARRSDISRQEIVERLLYPLINEGARILEDGIAYRPGDIDVVWTAGYGFPDHRGGPMFMADQIGLAEIAARMTHHARLRGGDPLGYWSVSPLLAELARRGLRISDQGVSSS